ncbi:MAG: hypothetical protein GSR85_10000 [Desulfurococcales archaeon]|nr:hypothetical protein [Desulfurococcales archaeon]
MAVKSRHEEVGICPSCGGISKYTYTITGPRDDDPTVIDVHVSITCNICGYGEEKRVILPVKAFYMLRYLFQPEIRLVSEKLMYISNMKQAKAQVSQ